MNSFPASTYLLAVLFALFLFATVAGALLAVLTARIIRGVCGLALCCLGLAGLYYFLHSPFLALMEILIYVGAVCVTIIFAIMLAEPEEQPVAEGRAFRSVLATLSALLVSGGLFAGLAFLGMTARWTPAAVRVSDGSVKALGTSLLTTYSLAFELISLVLLVAIVGALVVARWGRSKQ